MQVENLYKDTKSVPIQRKPIYETRSVRKPIQSNINHKVCLLVFYIKKYKNQKIDPIQTHFWLEWIRSYLI